MQPLIAEMFLQSGMSAKQPGYFLPVLLGVVAVVGAQQNDFDSVLGFGAFFNVFVVLGAICGVMGFVRLTNPR